MWSSVCVHQELLEIAVCLAADSRLAFTSLALIARPLAGALFWKTASCSFTLMCNGSGCSILDARKFSRMPVSSGVYQRWSKSRNPHVRPLSSPLYGLMLAKGAVCRSLRVPSLGMFAASGPLVAFTLTRVGDAPGLAVLLPPGAAVAELAAAAVGVLLLLLPPQPASARPARPTPVTAAPPRTFRRATRFVQ